MLIVDYKSDISAQNSDNQVQLLILFSWVFVFPLFYFQDHVFGCLLLVVNTLSSWGLSRCCSNIAKVQS